MFNIIIVINYHLGVDEEPVGVDWYHHPRLVALGPLPRPVHPPLQIRLGPHIRARAGVTGGAVGPVEAPPVTRNIHNKHA
eukprot:676245-Prorocentrum_minimum.AAC.1